MTMVVGPGLRFSVPSFSTCSELAFICTLSTDFKSRTKNSPRLASTFARIKGRNFFYIMRSDPESLIDRTESFTRYIQRNLCSFLFTNLFIMTFIRVMCLILLSIIYI